jgi:hypothetical protein
MGVPFWRPGHLDRARNGDTSFRGRPAGRVNGVEAATVKLFLDANTIGGRHGSG